MSKTQVRPSRDLRNNYADVVKSIKQGNSHIIITNKGVGEIVLISMDEYADFEEFQHHRFIYNELQKSKALENDPNIKRVSQDEMVALLIGQRRARNNV